MTIVVEPTVEAAAGAPCPPRRTDAARFPSRTPAADWPATRLACGEAFELLTSPPFVTPSPGSQKQRRRGLRSLLEWLASCPGASWQDRWLASGTETAGPGWRTIPAGWLRDQGRACADATVDAVCGALPLAIGADLVRPSVGWFVAAVPRGGALARTMAQTRDAEGFALLRRACDQDTGRLPAAAAVHTRHRVAILLGANGGRIVDIVLGDLLELLDVEADIHQKPMPHAVACFRTLRRMGIFGPQAPATLQQVRSIGQLSCGELVDRYRLACQPVRDLLVDYLRERQPALDYSSLRSLAASLANVFWKDLERHHPGIDDLKLTREVATAWKQRLRTRRATAPACAGDQQAATVERISYRQCLTPVRAFYLDLAQWALEDPARWAQWVAPCPIGAEEINQRKAARRRKARMDARTRERLPVLPVLVRTAAERHKQAETSLQTARQTTPGDSFTIDG